MPILPAPYAPGRPRGSSRVPVFTNVYIHCHPHAQPPCVAGAKCHLTDDGGSRFQDQGWGRWRGDSRPREPRQQREVGFRNEQEMLLVYESRVASCKISTFYQQKCKPIFHQLQTKIALAGVAQWIGHPPTNQKVTSLIPSQGTCLGCGPGPQLLACERQRIGVSLPPFPSLEK